MGNGWIEGAERDRAKGSGYMSYEGQRKGIHVLNEVNSEDVGAREVERGCWNWKG